MYTDDELLFFLPSKQQNALYRAIGLRLLEIERFLSVDISTFLEYTSFTKNYFFSHNSGSVQFCFEYNLNHAFDVYGEQLSVVLLPETITNTEFEECYKLSEMNTLVPKKIIDCLGKVCEDVRIWTLSEDFESEEAKEVAVSYLFSNNCELFYCIYLHDDLSSDYLMLRQNR